MPKPTTDPKSEPTVVSPTPTEAPKSSRSGVTRRLHVAYALDPADSTIIRDFQWFGTEIAASRFVRDNKAYEYAELGPGESLAEIVKARA